MISRHADWNIESAGPLKLQSQRALLGTDLTITSGSLVIRAVQPPARVFWQTLRRPCIGAAKRPLLHLGDIA